MDRNRAPAKKKGQTPGSGHPGIKYQRQIQSRERNTNTQLWFEIQKDRYLLCHNATVNTVLLCPQRQSLPRRPSSNLTERCHASRSFAKGTQGFERVCHVCTFLLVRQRSLVTVRSLFRSFSGSDRTPLSPAAARNQQGEDFLCRLRKSHWPLVPDPLFEDIVSSSSELGIRRVKGLRL